VDTNSDDDVRTPAGPAPGPVPVGAVPAAVTGGGPEPTPDRLRPAAGILIGCCPLCVEAAPLRSRRPTRGGDDLATALRITVSR
jgi:hypothetical protein